VTRVRNVLILLVVLCTAVGIALAATGQLQPEGSPRLDPDTPLGKPGVVSREDDLIFTARVRLCPPEWDPANCTRGDAVEVSIVIDGVSVLLTTTTQRDWHQVVRVPRGSRATLGALQVDARWLFCGWERNNRPLPSTQDLTQLVGEVVCVLELRGLLG